MGANTITWGDIEVLAGSKLAPSIDSPTGETMSEPIEVTPCRRTIW